MLADFANSKLEPTRMYVMAVDVLATLFHYDVIKRKYFPRYCPFVWGIYLSPVDSPHKGTDLMLLYCPSEQIVQQTLDWPLIRDVMTVIWRCRNGPRYQKLWCLHSMMTSSNGNMFRVTGHLCGEFTGDRWIPRTKASDAELWCFLWSAPETTVE